MAVESAKPVDPPGGEEIQSPRVSKSAAALRITMEEIRAVAQQFADEPVQSPEAGVWGVLTAISNNARQRRQGMNIRLRLDEHLIGRCVEDSRFKINSLAISATHCRIYREKASENSSSNIPSVFVKDTSTNGTYLNWDKLTKDMPGSRLRHGDILAFAAPPHEGNSYAYVYREVYGARLSENGTATLKRQREDVSSGCKRQKGIGIGSVDGPISLDDVRSLQRSNSDLRQQLESHVRTIETLKSESRESLARHENEIKELKETISGSFEKQIKELEHELDKAHKELDKLHTVKVDLDYSIEDLRERLNASRQSRSDADDIILSQKATISELEKQLEEEQKMRREERDKAAEDLRSALERAHAEAKEESKRQANIYQRQHKEQQEVITKLQECEKESRLLVETLRSKLDDARENLIISEKKVRQLESQVQDEQLACTNSKKRSEDLESELRSLKAELENEKVAREQAWAKVSALELEIAAAIRDLSVEKRRFQGARERAIQDIILDKMEDLVHRHRYKSQATEKRETQLRAFYSTTEEISALFARQQEQLKAMQRTLEDEDHYENTLTDIDLNQTPPRKVDARNEDTCPNTATREVSQECVAESSGRDSVDGDASTTVKNSNNNDTQDLECTSVYQSVQGTDMNVDGGVSTAVVHAKEQIDTEQVLETEIQAGDGRVQKCWNMEGETMQLDEDTIPAENFTEPITRPEVDARLEDTEPCQVQTADLLTSEAVGSWAVSTAPSINVGNESPRKVTNAEAVGANALIGLVSQASGSQSNKVNESRKLTKEQKMLNAMIEIVDPEFGQKIAASGGVRTGSDISDAETEEGDNDGDNDSKSGTDDDSKSGGGDDASNDGGDDDSDGSDTMIKDSVG